MAKIGDDISSARKDYQRSVLMESDVSNDPFQQFEKWLQEAREVDPDNFNAFHLNTLDEQGFPDSRVVLLKGVEQHGFVFFTNYNSQKGKDIDRCNKVGGNFFWPELERQVRFRGIAEKVSAAESDEYFASRPRMSQIGAIASAQSELLKTRDELENRVMQLDEEYTGQDIPRPKHWGGYRITPNHFEFWQGRASRLHDRLVYQMDADGMWFFHRISP